MNALAPISLHTQPEIRVIYRSRHESLIAFSNRNYEDSKLVTFLLR